MISPIFIRFHSPEALASAAAARWVAEVKTASRSGLTRYCVALSGGRIARPLFLQIAQEARATGTDMRNVDFFWADERCVPPSDSESNFGVAQQWLFAPLAIPPERIHRIAGELEPAEAAAGAESRLRAIAPVNASGLPVLDLVWLGMGEDGHIASLFPDAPSEPSNSSQAYRAVVGPKPPPHRVTLTYRALAAARWVFVLASGAGKGEALRRSLADSASTPLGRLLMLRASTVIFTDVET